MGCLSKIIREARWAHFFVSLGRICKAGFGCAWLQSCPPSFSALRLPQPSSARLWSRSLVRPRGSIFSLTLTTNLLCKYALIFVISFLTSMRGYSSVPFVSCIDNDGNPCILNSLGTSDRVVLFFPAGFHAEQVIEYFNEVQKITNIVKTSPTSVYAGRYHQKIFYAVAWLPGGDVGSSTATFKAAIPNNPFRGKALSLNIDEVIQSTDEVSKAYGFSPFASVVLYNSSDSSAVANASPPGFLGKPYGILKIQKIRSDDYYTFPHELGHAGLNFLDEYIENGFQDANIRLLDYLTPLALIGGPGGLGAAMDDLFRIYDISISDIIASNGNENIDTTKWVSRVSTDGFPSTFFKFEGGMFFGKGTFHHEGRNLMGGSRNTTDPSDGFDYAQSPNQDQLAQYVFGDRVHPPRPNDRVRAVGPKEGWAGVLGSSVDLMWFDGDKNHHFFPTRQYTVQVGWYDRTWKVCWASIVPYPCYDTVWKTYERAIQPVRQEIHIRQTALYGVARFSQNVLCSLGVRSIPMAGGKQLDLCSQEIGTVAEAFLPSFSFPMPYERVSFPLSQSFSKYFWRVRTNNGSYDSGYTAWSSFSRSF